MAVTDDLRKAIIFYALDLLGTKYSSSEAMQIMAAIAYQESNFTDRHQKGGPAHGFWQFERGGGTFGVMNHASTKKAAQMVCKHFKVPFESNKVYNALETNDILAACFARLLLWTLPDPIPTDITEAWDYYIDAWRPGKPHPQRWIPSWEKAILLLS